MPQSHSSYYPPRARWPRFVRQGWFEWRRGRQLWKMASPHRVAFRHWATALILPGCGFWVAGKRILGAAVVASYLLAAAVCLGCIGSPPAVAAFGWMIAAHALSVAHLAVWRVGSATFLERISLTAIALVFFYFGVYYQLHRWTVTHLVLPLRSPTRIILIDPSRRSVPLEVGEFVAVVIPARSTGRIVIRGGPGVGEVLAGPGDRIRAVPEGLEVNGRLRPSPAGMPSQGEWRVPEKHWFVWAPLHILGRGAAPEHELADALGKTAMIAENQILGRPYRRWFGRQLKVP